MKNKEELFKSSWELLIVCARFTFSLLGYKIRMSHRVLKVAILIIGIAIYAFLWNTMTRFDGYDGNCIDEPFLIWLSFPRSSHIKLMLKTFLPLLPFFSSQQVTYFMFIATLYREGNFILIGILTKLKKHQSSLPFWKKGPWPADKNTS